MKYLSSIDIDLPLHKVVSLFDDPENLNHWQPGFISMEPVEGVPGQERAKSRLTYQLGARRIEMIETIFTRNLPTEFSGTYETAGVWNMVINRFEELDDHSTRWVAENEFRFSGIFMRIIGWLSPGSFKKQSQLYLGHFKRFAENPNE